MNKNIILCGVGGQGTVLASKLISAAAMEKGYEVKSAETIGMSQRGGCVFSYIRIGDKAHSPMIRKKTADILIAFEPCEAVRMLPYLKDDGVCVVSNEVIVPVTGSLNKTSFNSDEMIDILSKKVGKLYVVDAKSALLSVGSSKVLNIILLSAAISSNELGLNKEDIRNVIIKKVPEKFHELNFKALDYYTSEKTIMDF